MLQKGRQTQLLLGVVTSAHKESKQQGDLKGAGADKDI